MKLENIMISKKSSGEISVKLIDYGFATKYKSSSGKLVIREEDEVEYFKGNILFGSIRQL